MIRGIFARSLIVTSLGLGAASMALGGCDNPTKDKPRADVAAPGAEMQAVKGAESAAITPADSKIEFVGRKITGSHEGSFKAFKGSIDLVPATLTASRVSVEIETGSLVSDQEKLTGHLKSGDFFDVEKFPKATFTSTEIKPGGAGGATHTITGNLELHGVKKSISFPAKVTVDASAVKADAEFVINRKDFGLVYPGKPDDLIKDEVLIKLHVTAPRKKS
jgi:polyisoprenoid-binding protein YceI